MSSENKLPENSEAKKGKTVEEKAFKNLQKFHEGRLLSKACTLLSASLTDKKRSLKPSDVLILLEDMIKYPYLPETVEETINRLNIGKLRLRKDL